MPENIKKLFMHGGLFLLTLITTTLSGSEWTIGKNIFYTDFSLNDFYQGMYFSVPFLFVLGVHEFGHYFTAQFHKVKVTLPYFIPFYFGFIGVPSIGTMGALIRIKERINSRMKYFDIGIAGPLAGFVVALAVIFYGFTHLPPPEHIYSIHPEYEQYGENYADYVYESDTSETMYLGTNLIFQFFETYVADPELVPNKYEMMHYPWLFAGFLSLFFTALNLIPIGQLDGGHILYGLVGHKKQGFISSILFLALLFYSGLGLIPFDQPLVVLLQDSVLYVGFLYICLHHFTSKWKDKLMIAMVIYTVQFLIAFVAPGTIGFTWLLVFGLLIGRFIGIRHPKAENDEAISTGRQVLGWIALLIFVLSFSLDPFVIE